MSYFSVLNRDFGVFAAPSSETKEVLLKFSQTPACSLFSISIWSQSPHNLWGQQAVEEGTSSAPNSPFYISSQTLNLPALPTAKLKRCSAFIKPCY